MEKNVIRAILAHDANWGIGKNGDLPWPKNNEDLKWFKETTSGDVVIMGRNTWDSLPFKPLPNRTNVIVTTQDIKGALGNIVVDMKSLLKILPQIKFGNKDIWVIGGAQLVEGMMPYIDEFWLNNVDGDYECDTFLPKRKIEKLYSVYNVEIKSFGKITKWVKK
ncbi:dihydrofolate reductase [bacterium]|nr:dihydrofolate reductase [bacterium]